MFAGVGGGLLIFVIGLLAKSTNISVLGIIGSATSGGVGRVGQIMIQNTKKLRTDEEIFAEKRQELEKAISESQNRANHIYRLDYFDIDRNKPDFINFNAYGFTFSDGITKASEFQIIEKEKIYNTRTIKEVSRTTKTKVYYKEKQEKYIDKVRFEIHYNQEEVETFLGKFLTQ